MKKITILVLAACVVLAAGCRWVGIRGNGHIKTDERTISAFANIDASGAFQIEWKNGAPALSVTTDENLLSYIDNHISGDTLRLQVLREDGESPECGPNDLRAQKAIYETAPFTRSS